jgi:hypothetical protein
MVAHVILFENAGFGGDHLHVFNEVETLGTISGHSFNDEGSSLAVLEGNWQFFKDYQWGDSFPNVLGPGAYTGITEALGRADANDSLTGLRPVELY